MTPGGVLQILSDGDDRMGKNQTPKNPWTKNLTPPPQKKKSHAEFLSLKNFQKG